MTIILASRSPRRAELLTQLGVGFEQVVADVDETRHDDETATDYVIRIARLKAETVGVQQQRPTLGADTAVVLDGEPLGKPVDKADYNAVLRRLSGRQHQVMTAICIYHEGQCYCHLVTTQVWFKTLSDAEIERYWQTGEPTDKAGGYGIQGIGGRFIPRIEGSYSAVVGLPLFETAELLQELAINEC